MLKITLRCRSHNIVTIFISGIVYSNQVSHTIIQKLNGLLLNECAKYGFHLVDKRAVSKENLWKVGVHLVESSKVIIANNLLNCINNFLGVANSVLRTLLTENYSGEKFRKDLCSDNLDKADKAGDLYGYLNQQANDNPINGASLNPLSKTKN